MEDFKTQFREFAPIIARAIGGFACMGLAVAIILSPILWLQASQEAAAFNRFTTGPKATTWDALWVEFRVEAER